MTLARAVARLSVVGWIGLYTIVLLWSVQEIIAPKFGYQGYIGRSHTSFDVIVAVVATIITSMTLSPHIRRPSEMAQLFLVLTCAVPVIWVPVLYGPLRSTQTQALALSVAGAFVVIWLCLRGARHRLEPLRLSRLTFWLWVAVFGSVSVAYLVASGITPHLSGFGAVYSQREEFSQNVDQIGGYLVGWLAGGTFSVVLAVALYRRSLPLVAVGLAGVLLLYSLTGYKSYAFGVVILLGTALLTRRGSSRTWHWAALLAALITLVGVVDVVRGDFRLTSLVVRRGISTAGMNTGFYVDKFDGGPYYELRHSILSFMAGVPYGSPPGAVVGKTYYGESTVANANFMADGFANFGWVGIPLAALLVGVLLRVYDKASAGFPLGVSAPALVFVLLALANTAVLTVVATHGAAVLIAWVALAPASLATARRTTGSAGTGPPLGAKADAPRPAGSGAR